MKIISWNCNMAFRKKYEYVTAIGTDLLVIQECEHKQILEKALDLEAYNDIIWIGNNKNKGLGVISFNDYYLEQLDVYNEAYKYVLPLKLSKERNSINVLAIWAMPHEKDRKKDYVGQVWGAINYYKHLFDGPTILVGDFNSNAIWNAQRKEGNHTDVVNFLAAKKILSLYHNENKVEHGEEKDPTIYLLKNLKKPYHLDYCFASSKLIGNKTSIEVGKHKDWLKLSDHMPLLINGLKFG